MPFVEEPLVGDLFEDGPYTLDVRRLIRYVGAGVVEPVSDALRQRFPIFLVGSNRLTTDLVELFDADPLDVGFARNTQLSLGLDFDR